MSSLSSSSSSSEPKSSSSSSSSLLGKRGKRDSKPSIKQKEAKEEQRLKKQKEQQRLEAKRQRLKNQRMKQRLGKQRKKNTKNDSKTPTPDFFNISPSNPFDISSPKKSTMVSPDLFSTPTPDFDSAKIETPADSYDLSPPYDPNSPSNMGSPHKYKKEDSDNILDALATFDDIDPNEPIPDDSAISDDPVIRNGLELNINLPKPPKPKEPRLRF